MYTVISDDGSFPNYLKKEQIELYTIKEFTAIASSDDGITIDKDGLFVNILNIDTYIIEALEQYRACDVEIKYFGTSNIAWPICVPLDAIDNDFVRIGVAFGRKIPKIL